MSDGRTPAEIRAERIHGGLRGESWRPVRHDLPSRRLTILLASGTARIETRDGPVRMDGPCLAHYAARDVSAVRIGPGGSALLCDAYEAAMLRAVGLSNETDGVRALMSHNSVTRLDESGPDLAFIAFVLSSLAEELARQGGRGSAAPAALVTLLLTRISRLRAPDEIPAPGMGARMRLQLFRQIVEQRFRERWPVRRYAAALGLTPDHLHDLCRHRIGRSPRSLIDERTALEAQKLLVGTSMSVSEIAHYLGFRDPSYFSRFVLRKLGARPSHMRRALASHSAAPPPQSRFSEWP